MSEKAATKEAMAVDARLIVQLAKALAVEVHNCELKGSDSAHHEHCRALIANAERYA